MPLSIASHRFFERLKTPRRSVWRRDPVTQLVVKDVIANAIRARAEAGAALLEVGCNFGHQTVIYREQIPAPGETVGYDWQDRRAAEVVADFRFRQVDLERDRFPDADASFDFVVCNQVFEHIKNIFTPMSEIARVLRPGGWLIFSVPNLAALHNRILLGLGRQPTTIDISGNHVRGYAIRSMSRFLTAQDHFEIEQVVGIGLHPFCSWTMPGPFRSLCHTPVWVCRRKASRGPSWQALRKLTPTTTKFFE